MAVSSHRLAECALPHVRLVELKMGPGRHLFSRILLY
jgi:hypothetical protein